MRSRYSLSGISVVTPYEFLAHSSIVIDGNKIAKIGEKADADIPMGKKLYAYPSLINIHDHLRGNYLPKVGPKEGTFYLNWSYWDNDLHVAPVFSEREKNSVEDLYLLSAYKNIFSGVTTVNDHFPHAINDPLIPTLPLRVIKEYALEHSAQSFSLKWGEGIEAEHKRAIKKNWPFIIHCEEGFDAETQGDIERIEKIKCLDDHTVLIHCIGLSEADIAKIKKAGASIVWCPGSNMFMFNVTCKIRKLLAANINVSIGSDATHSGSANLLEEMRFARDTYRLLYAQDIEPKILFEMVTSNPARALRMADKIGTIEVGKMADILVIAARKEDPYEALLDCRMEDIELLLLAGNPIYGAKSYESLFTDRGTMYHEEKVRGSRKLVVGDPGGLLARIRSNVGFKKVFDFLPLDS